jgi:hypothetical protein
MLKASPPRVPDPLLVFFGKTCPEVIQGAFAASVMVFPQQSAEKAGRIQVSLDIEYVEKNHDNPQGKVREPIFEEVVLFLLFGWG